MTTPIQALHELERMRLATDDPREAESLELAIEAMREKHYVSLDTLERLRKGEVRL